MITHSTIGKFAIRFTLVAYLIVVVVSLFDYSSSISEQKSALQHKSLIKEFSLILNEEKETEGDDNEVKSPRILFIGSFQEIDFYTQFRVASHRATALNTRKIFLYHCTLLI